MSEGADYVKTPIRLLFASLSLVCADAMAETLVAEPVECPIWPASLVGTAADDALYDGECDTFLLGEDGNDLLSGGSGADYLNGGLGDDHLVGGPGDDQLFITEGRDLIVPGSGLDRITIGSIKDLAIAPEKRDVLVIDVEESDVIVLGPAFGSDWVFRYPDQCSGRGHEWTLSGETWDDRILVFFLDADCKPDGTLQLLGPPYFTIEKLDDAVESYIDH